MPTRRVPIRRVHVQGVIQFHHRFSCVDRSWLYEERKQTVVQLTLDVNLEILKFLTKK